MNPSVNLRAKGSSCFVFQLAQSIESRNLHANEDSSGNRHPHAPKKPQLICTNPYWLPIYSKSSTFYWFTMAVFGPEILIFSLKEQLQKGVLLIPRDYQSL